MFNYSLNVGLSQPVESNEITISGQTGTKTVVLGPPGTTTNLLNADIKKNGVSVGASTTVVNGDTLKITGTSNSINSSPSFASLLVEGEFLAIYGCITVQAYTDRAWTELDPTVNFNYTPTASNARLLKIANDDEITVLSETPEVFQDTSYFVATRYLDDMLIFYDPANNNASQRARVRPWAVTYSPTEAPSLNISTYTIVARHVDSGHQVSVYSGVTNALVASASHSPPNNGKPMAVAGCKTSDDNTFQFWYACFDGKVYLMNYNITTSTLTTVHTVDLGATYRPNHITVDAANNAYVSAPDTNGTHRVVKINFTDGAVHNYNVSGIPRQSAFKGSALYVCLQDVASVAIIDINTSSVSTRSCIVNPTHCVITGNRLYLASDNTGAMSHYDITATLTLATPTPLPNNRRMLGMVADPDSSSIYVSLAYEDSPINEGFVDRAPDNVIIPNQNVILGALNSTGNLTLSGIVSPCTIQVPLAYNMGMSKNGTGFKTSESYVNGDVAKFTYSHTTLPVDMYIPILWDNGGVMWNLTYVPTTGGGGGSGVRPIRVAGRIKG